MQVSFQQRGWILQESDGGGKSRNGNAEQEWRKLICNIPVRSQTQQCTSEPLPLAHAIWRGEKNGGFPSVQTL